MPDSHKHAMQNYWADIKPRALREFNDGYILITPSFNPRGHYCSQTTLARASKEIQRIFDGREPLIINLSLEHNAELNRTDRKLNCLPLDVEKPATLQSFKKTSFVSKELIRYCNQKYGFIDGDPYIESYLGIRK